MANKAIISGTITKPEFSHETYREKFYQFFIKSERKSETVDIIPVIASEYFAEKLEEGTRILIEGEIRTYSKHEDDGKNRLMVQFFAKDVFEPSEYDENSVEIDGYLCKQPMYRVTRYEREIADILIESNRGYGKSDYIPSIAWGRKARWITSKKIGTEVIGRGRIQSRNYTKKYSDGTEEQRVAYELSLSSVGIYEEGEKNG